MSKSAAIAKIEKLLELSRRTGNRFEAEAFASKARRTAETHSVTTSDVRKKYGKLLK